MVLYNAFQSVWCYTTHYKVYDVQCIPKCMVSCNTLQSVWCCATHSKVYAVVQHIPKCILLCETILNEWGKWVMWNIPGYQTYPADNPDQHRRLFNVSESQRHCFQWFHYISSVRLKSVHHQDGSRAAYTCPPPRELTWHWNRTGPRMREKAVPMDGCWPGRWHCTYNFTRSLCLKDTSTQI